MSEAQIEAGGRVLGHKSGRWAAEQMVKAIKNGEALSPGLLRTADILRKDEWIEYDEAVLEEALPPMVGINDLIAGGLTKPISNSMGKTMIQWQAMADMEDAIVSLSGIDRSENDAVDFELAGIPLPITHKDFDINIRTLAASRNLGEALDTIQARISGRKVGEKLEEMLFIGGPTFGGSTIYGYTNHPNVNRTQFGSAGELWTAAGKTPEEIFADVVAMIVKLQAANHFGPYVLYVPSTYSIVLDADFKATGDLTLRQRLLQIEGLRAIRTAHKLPADTVVLVQMTREVVMLAQGEPIQTVQWDFDGGFVVKFKVFTIQVPIIRADAADRSGIVVANATGAA